MESLVSLKDVSVPISRKQKRKAVPTEKMVRRTKVRSDTDVVANTSKPKPKVKIIYKIIKTPSARLPYEVDIDDSHFPGLSLSLTDCSPHLYISSDALVVHGSTENGYSMVRSNQGVGNGVYYWEAIILPPVDANNESFLRIGWADRLADIFSYVGSDNHGFGFGNSSDGCLLHNRHREDGYGVKYGPGDVVGVMCNVYSGIEGQTNHIRFFVNGCDQGPAFENNSQLAQRSTLFAAVSLYRQARVRVNFGPSFVFPPSSLSWKSENDRCLLTKCLPVSELKPLSLKDRLEHDKLVASTRIFVDSLRNSSP